MASRRGVAVAAALALAACGCLGVAVAAEEKDAAVDSHTAQPPTRDEMIRAWSELLVAHGENPPDTSAMSAEEIERGWSRDRIRFADPAADDMGVSACASWKSGLFDPDCW
ncbi:hypothetical protein ACFV9D_08055 [Streptomyces sp. NPDC059875]|uniref:hypothetical protein n=1 Tax=unclassified Streptomyces TaxID=2593676 RepID=UPI00364DF5B3